MHTFDTSSVDNKFVFHKVTQNDVRDSFNKLRNLKSKDIYGLSGEIIKSVKDILICPFTKLFNYCLETNTFPKCLKNSIVIPI